MNIFKRLYTIGKTELNSALENFEDPIKLTENGISEMKDELRKSTEQLAQLKALLIRKKNEKQAEVDVAKDYQNKAILIIQKSENGEMPSEEADRLAIEAIKKQNISNEKAEQLQAESQKLQHECEKMQTNIHHLESSISKWENELRTLKSRVQISEATKDINRKMTQIDSNSTVSMLEKLNERVAEQEALSEAYGEISNDKKTVDQEIDDILKNTDQEAEKALKKLKESLKKE